LASQLFTVDKTHFFELPKSYSSYKKIYHEICYRTESGQQGIVLLQFYALLKKNFSFPAELINKIFDASYPFSYHYSSVCSLNILKNNIQGVSNYTIEEICTFADYCLLLNITYKTLHDMQNYLTIFQDFKRHSIIPSDSKIIEAYDTKEPLSHTIEVGLLLNTYNNTPWNNEPLAARIKGDDVIVYNIEQSVQTNTIIAQYIMSFDKRILACLYASEFLCIESINKNIHNACQIDDRVEVYNLITKMLVYTIHLPDSNCRFNLFYFDKKHIYIFDNITKKYYSWSLFDPMNR